MLKLLAGLMGCQCGLALLAGCGDSKTEQPDGPAGGAAPRVSATSSAEELLAALVAKADAATAAEDKRQAFDVLDVALEFSPADDVALAGKLTALGDRPLQGMDVEQANRMVKLIEKAPLDLENPPPATSAAETQRVELRMLLDQRLVGDMAFGRMSAEEMDAGMCLFIAKPSIQVDDVLTDYGEPTSQTEQDGYRTLNYGRIRLIADNSGDVVAVLFRSRAGGNSAS